MAGASGFGDESTLVRVLLDAGGLVFLVVYGIAVDADRGVLCGAQFDDVCDFFRWRGVLLSVACGGGAVQSAWVGGKYRGLDGGRVRSGSCVRPVAHGGMAAMVNRVLSAMGNSCLKGLAGC